jgi:hypothetical protein
MRGRIGVAAAALALCLLGPASGAAAKPPRFHHLIMGTGPAMTDGTRFVVVPAPGATVVVYDSRTAMRRTEPDPVTRAADGQDHPCPPQDVGGETLLWSCGQIEDLLTGRYQDASAIEYPAAYSDALLLHVGRYWVERFATDYTAVHSQPFPVFINWHTAQVRFSAFMNHYGDHHVEDLDWPTLMRPLCRPLQRPRYGTEDGYGGVTSAYAEFTYEPPFALTQSSRGEPLVGRCGQDGLSRVAHCFAERVQCLYAQLGGGIVTWSDAIGVYAYRGASRRRLAWNVLAASGSQDPGVILPVAHTVRDVVVSVPRGGYTYNPYYPVYLQGASFDIRIARLPRSG